MELACAVLHLRQYKLMTGTVGSKVHGICSSPLLGCEPVQNDHLLLFEWCWQKSTPFGIAGIKSWITKGRTLKEHCEVLDAICDITALYSCLSIGGKVQVVDSDSERLYVAGFHCRSQSPSPPNTYHLTLSVVTGIQQGPDTLVSSVVLLLLWFTWVNKKVVFL
jgi:hypothetical protein